MKPTLANEYVRLERLSAGHSASLVEILDEELWMGMTIPTPRSVAEMQEYVESLLCDESRLPFAVISAPDDRIIGSTCLNELSLAQERVEIGNTFYARSEWGGVVNPSCKLLLLGYAFDELKLHRVALRCDSRNTRSASAIKKLGATYEGDMRGHRIAADGTRGDTSYFSILEPEWPQVKARLEARLA